MKSYSIYLNFTQHLKIKLNKSIMNLKIILNNKNQYNKV